MALAGQFLPLVYHILRFSNSFLKKFDEYCGLDKEYEGEILLGMGSDSGDVMGRVERCGGYKGMEAARFEGVLNEFAGKATLPVPAYSSWRVQGKPLYWWARQGRLSEIEIPVHEFTVFSSQLLGVRDMEIEEVKGSVMGRLGMVQGDFRQEEIKKQWEEIFSERQEPFQSANFRIHCSSGTYIRSIVQEMGKRLEAGAMLYRLVRTRAGEYKIEDSIALDGNKNKTTSAP